jgi:hypothetical protein
MTDDVARKIALVNDHLRPGGYLGISYSKYDDGSERAQLHGTGAGSDHPTVFRTLKGAYQNIGLYARNDPEKIILLLDLSLLPVVLPDQNIERRRGYSEAAFAERQMELWTRITEERIKVR